MHPQTDHELLQAVAQQRDKKAFAELMTRYQSNAFSLALRMTRDRSKAEEVLQEAMLAVWTSAKSFRSDGLPKSWILRIVATESLKLLKRSQVHARQVQRKTLNEEKRIPALDPSQVEEKSELLKRLGQCVERLPLKQQQLLALYYGAEMSQDEIGKTLSIPQRTLSFRLDQILKILRSNLSEAGFAGVIGGTLDAGLKELMLDSALPPAGMARHILNRLDNGASILTKSTLTGKRIAIAAGSCVIICVSAIVLWGLPNSSKSIVPDSDEIQRNSKFNSENIQVAEKKPFYFHLDFSKKSKTTLKPERGSWRWENPPGAPAGMTVSNTVTFVLPCEIPDTPFYLRLTLVPPGSNELKRSLKGKIIFHQKGSYIPMDFVLMKSSESFSSWDEAGKKRFTSEVYCDGKYIMGLINGSLQYLCKYEKDFPSNRIALLLKNWRILDIVVRERAIPDWPEKFQRPWKLYEQLATQGIGPQHFPEKW